MSVSQPTPAPPAQPAPVGAAPAEVTRLSDLTPTQWKSGIAAWLGWMFDGLDMHLYTLVALPFVASLLHVEKSDPAVGWYSSWIQAAFLMGWAIGGGFFGFIADRIGRSRALMLTILTYALFTGLSFFAQTWWHLFLFRFLAALGIGGEWAVGASLLSETWPKHWRPWLAAILQTGVNIGVLLATVAGFLLSKYPERYVFLVGLLPALIVLWIRKAVPEPAEWQAARDESAGAEPGVADLFQGALRRTTLITILVCSLSLTAHWAFMFWYQSHLRHLPDVQSWSSDQLTRLVSGALALLMVTSIIGNFLAAGLARLLGYRTAIVICCVAYGASMLGTYGVARDHESMWYWLPAMGLSQGVFALFTMYLPPLFPTLLRTTGAGFCYNIGRLAAAFGTVFFGLFNHVGDYRHALLYVGFLWAPAALAAWFLPESQAASDDLPTAAAAQPAVEPLD